MMTTQTISSGQQVLIFGADGKPVPARVTQVYGFEGLERVPQEEAQAGAVVSRLISAIDRRHQRALGLDVHDARAQHGLVRDLQRPARQRVRALADRPVGARAHGLAPDALAPFGDAPAAPNGRPRA